MECIIGEFRKFTPEGKKTDETLSQVGYDSVITTKSNYLGGSSVMAIIPQMSLFAWTDLEEYVSIFSRKLKKDL